MTLDFCRDLCDAVEKSGIEYVLITVQKSKTNGEFLINSFDSFKNKEVILIALESKIQEIQERPEQKTKGKNGK